MTNVLNNFYSLLQSETEVVSGCTEPAAVAFSFAVLKKYFPELNSIVKFDDIKAELIISNNVLRNASTAGLPYLNFNGINAVVAAGICSKKVIYNLFTKLSNIDKKNILYLSNRNNWLTITKLNKKDIYIKSKLHFNDNVYESEINKKHNNIVSIKKNNIEYLNNANTKEIKIKNLQEIKMISDNYDNNIEEIAKFILSTNGKLYEKFKTENLFITLSEIVKKRMLGNTLEVCTFTGSGNQCLFISIPFYTLYKNNIDNALKGFIFSLFTQIFLTQQKGRISKYCGLSEKAALSLLAGFLYLENKSINEIETKILILQESAKGLLCKGAKKDCANKCIMCINNVFYEFFLTKKLNINYNDLVIKLV